MGGEVLLNKLAPLLIMALLGGCDIAPKNSRDRSLGSAPSEDSTQPDNQSLRDEEQVEELEELEELEEQPYIPVIITDCVSVTQSVALAAAVSSVLFKGQELIHGVHGAAFQFHVRFSDLAVDSFSEFARYFGW